MKNDVRRTQILDTATAQVVAQGWDKTSHRTIAAACAVNETTVYSHFSKRSDLRDALMGARPDLALPVEADKRMKPDDRHKQLIEVGLTLAAAQGYKNVTMEALMAAAGVSRTLYARYFSNVNQFRVEIMRAAVKRAILPIIAQGLAAQDPHAMKAHEALRKEAVATLVA
jgi:AcrR family transcriptional regulator